MTAAFSQLLYKVTLNFCILSFNGTLNSRKYRTLFINYDFRWLMVAEIFWKYRSKHWIILDNNSDFQNGAAQAIFHSPRRNTLCTSGCATIVFWGKWAQEMIVHNLKPIENFGDLNVFFFISMAWWLIFGVICPWMDRGWAKFPSKYFVN